MRPSRRPEREEKVGAYSQMLIMPICGADEEARLALAGVSPLFELLSKLHRCERFAPFVKDDGDGAARTLDRPSTVLGELRDLRWPGDALQVALNELGLGGAADLPSRDNVKKHPIGWL